MSLCRDIYARQVSAKFLRQCRSHSLRHLELRKQIVFRTERNTARHALRDWMQYANIKVRRRLSLLALSARYGFLDIRQIFALSQKIWRRVKDLNLRTPCGVTRFRGARFQPLSQLSKRLRAFPYGTSLPTFASRCAF